MGSKKGCKNGECPPFGCGEKWNAEDRPGAFGGCRRHEVPIWASGLVLGQT